MSAKVTTKFGDRGETRTLGGAVLPKDHAILECTGWVDLLRAQTALLRLELLEAGPDDADGHAAFLFWLLHVYFLIGTEVNDPKRAHPEYRQDEVGEKHLAALEAEQARLLSSLELPKAFIVCASTMLAAKADYTATITRTLERRIVTLKRDAPTFNAAHIEPFVNRLSDYFYVLARHLEGGRHQPVDYDQLNR